MFGLTTATPELIPVEEDADVQPLQAALSKAVAELEQLEQREKRMIAVVSGTPRGWTWAEEEASRAALRVRKGTQTGWFLPEAEDARKVVAELRDRHQTVVAAAREKLNAAGLAKLTALCGELGPVIAEAMEWAEKMDALRQEIGDMGGDLGVHPFPVLLPGSLLAGQLDIAKRRGLL
jgi:hypothetical protein